jgi:hypothetical protein
MSTVPIKIRINTRDLARNFTRIRDNFHKQVFDSLRSIIVTKLIKGGTSPVEGWGRFKDYAQSYKEKITADDAAIKGTDGNLWEGKKLRPVNLTVSDKMLDSFGMEILKDRIKVFFKSEFAVYHNDGIPSKAGPVRRPLLPSKTGEKFSRTVMRHLLKEASTSVDKELKKK